MRAVRRLRADRGGKIDRRSAPWPGTPFHIPFDPQAFRWQDIEQVPYKSGGIAERGMGWRGVARHTLASPETVPAGFELRYFELEPGGYSSIEKHAHVHFVIAVRGSGRALIGGRVVDVAPLDALYVPPLIPHRWLNESEAPFGFLCPVDGARDRPQPLSDAEWQALRADPATAPYVF